MTVNEALAAASEATHPQQAIGVYAERLEQIASVGGNGNDEATARLVARLGRLREAEEQSAYLADIRVRFRPKRNLLKLLVQ